MICKTLTCFKVKSADRYLTSCNCLKLFILALTKYMYYEKSYSKKVNQSIEQ